MTYYNIVLHYGSSAPPENFLRVYTGAIIPDLA